MSTLICDKLKSIRAELGLSQRIFAELVGIPESSYKSYELNKREMGANTLMSLLQHSECQKYSLWFLTGEIAPEIGQVAPGGDVQKSSADNMVLSQEEFDQQFTKAVEDSLLMFCHLDWFTPNFTKDDKIDFDTCSSIILKDVKPLLAKIPQHQQTLPLIEKTV